MTTKKTISLADIEMKDYLATKERIRCGITPIDKLLSGGFATGEIVQLVGETHTGKTTLSLQIAYNFCKQGKNVLFIDAKGDITPELLQQQLLMNYHKKQFFYVKEDVFTEVEKQLDKFIATGEIDLIIIDSLPSLINGRVIKLDSNKKITADNKNTNAGTKPLIHITNKLKKLSMQYGICLLFISEFREKVDRLRGSIDKVFGPKCLSYESSSIIQVKKITSFTNSCFKDKFSSLEDLNIGVSDEFKQLKGNSLKPLSEIPFFFEYGIGYHDKYCLIWNMLQEEKIIQSRSYYEYHGIKENGLANFIQALDKSGLLNALLENERENKMLSQYD